MKIQLRNEPEQSLEDYVDEQLNSYFEEGAVEQNTDGLRNLRDAFARLLNTLHNHNQSVFSHNEIIKIIRGY